MRRITIIAAALATAALARYSQYSATGYAPWYVAKDSSSVAGFADSARKADSSRAAWKADSAHVAWFAHAATYADSSRASHKSDSAAKAGWAPLDSSGVLGITSRAYVRKSGDTMSGTLRLSGEYGIGIDFLRNTATYGGVRLWHSGDASTYEGVKFQAISTSGGSSILPVWVIADIFSGTLLGQATSADSSRVSGTASNSTALGGIAAAQYGTLAQDTAISRKVVSDSLTANTRGWTTLAAAKSSIHDSLGVERTFDSIVARAVAHDSATAMRAYVGSASTTGNAATATKLTTSRTISMTGDGTWSTSFDGSANATGTLHLARLLASGSAGSASSVPTLTWDTTGRLTSVGSAAIAIPHTQISDWGAATSSFLTGNQAITLSGAVTGSGTTAITTSFANTHLAGIDQDLTTTSHPLFSRVSTLYDVTPTTSPNSNYVLAPLVAQRATSQSSTSMAGVGFHNVGTIGAFLYLNNSGHFQVNLNGGKIYSLIDGDNYPDFNNFTNGLTTTTLAASGSISEGGTALSAKYLGINASISTSKISDWGTYINQPLLTTSSPTFAGMTATGASQVSATLKVNELDLWKTGSNNDFVRMMVANAFVIFGDNNSYGSVPTSLYGIQCGNVWSSGYGAFNTLEVNTTSYFHDRITLVKGFADMVTSGNSITLDESQSGMAYGSFGAITLTSSALSVGRTYHVTNTNSTSVQLYVPTGITVYANGSNYVGGNSSITMTSSQSRLLIISHPATSVWSISY